MPGALWKTLLGGVTPQLLCVPPWPPNVRVLPRASFAPCHTISLEEPAAVRASTSTQSGLCRDGNPQTLGQSLCLRGLNIQYPFSQLILEGVKVKEARTYALGSRNIARPGEEMFLIETPGSRRTAGAMLGNTVLSPPPVAARVVGTVTFQDSQQYKSLKSWKADRDAHRIEEGARHDWQGPSVSEMHAWTVGATRRLAEPIHVGADKSMTGWSSARSLDVKFTAETAPELATHN